MSGMIYHMDSLTDTTNIVMVGGSGLLCYLDSLTVILWT